MALLPTLKARGAHFNELSERLGKLKSSMSATRKVLRFGKEIPLMTNIRNNLAKPRKRMTEKPLPDSGRSMEMPAINNARFSQN